jgi:pyruvate dehydrogenase E1 component beta subunit
VIVNGAEAIRLAIAEVLRRDERSLTFGLGINDPGRVFGTTLGLVEEFGESRVFESPTSEAAMTGVGVGLAISGRKVIHSHQRMDFALLAMDQIVNSAAKWSFMFGDNFTVPYLTRMIIGRGWGQGPTHSQNFESWLAHVPGLRVIVPATVQDLYDGITAILTTEEPIVFIEHRWLHLAEGELQLDKAPSHHLATRQYPTDKKPDLTIATWGLATFDCLAAKARLQLDFGLAAEIVQIRELRQVSINEVIRSSQETKNLLVAANSWGPASFASHVLASSQNTSGSGHIKGKVLTNPFTPEATSLRQLNEFHVSDWRVVNSCLELLGIEKRVKPEDPVDQPKGFNFGPF